MLDLTTNGWVWAILAAGLCGGVGGLVHDLLLERFGNAGMWELPTVQKPNDSNGRSYVDLGFLASVLVGIIAAVAFLYFLPPEVPAGTSDSDARTYDLLKLVPASVIVGAGGAAFLRAAVERQLKIVAATNLDNLADAVKQSQQAAVVAGEAAADNSNHDVNDKVALQQVQANLDALGGLAESLRVK